MGRLTRVLPETGAREMAVTSGRRRIRERPMNAEEKDEIHARERGKRVRAEPPPRGPQFRGCDVERLYPVQGYCVLSQSPGWFMIPSIEEHREYCTTPRFGECCWFRKKHESEGSVKAQAGEHPAQDDAWPNQQVLLPTVADAV